MQPFEDPCLLPAVQTPPAGLAGAESQLRGQELPGDVLVQDVQDALQAQAVRHRSLPRRPLGPGRQQWFDQRPQVVVHDPRPSRHTHRTVRSSQRSRPSRALQQDPITSSKAATSNHATRQDVCGLRQHDHSNRAEHTRSFRAGAWLAPATAQAGEMDITILSTGLPLIGWRGRTATTSGGGPAFNSTPTLALEQARVLHLLGGMGDGSADPRPAASATARAARSAVKVRSISAKRASCREAMRPLPSSAVLLGRGSASERTPICLSHPSGQGHRPQPGRAMAVRTVRRYCSAWPLNFAQV